MELMFQADAGSTGCVERFSPRSPVCRAAALEKKSVSRTDEWSEPGESTKSNSRCSLKWDPKRSLY